MLDTRLFYYTFMLSIPFSVSVDMWYLLPSNVVSQIILVVPGRRDDSN